MKKKKKKKLGKMISRNSLCRFRIKNKIRRICFRYKCYKNEFYGLLVYDCSLEIYGKKN